VSGSRLIPVLAAWAAVACTTFESTVCGEQVCPGDLACCGSQCVPRTCGDGELQLGEQCDTWTGRSCTTIGSDFGHLGCTATCELDVTTCLGFGFRSGGLPCDVPKPALVAAAGDTLWFGTRLNRAVRISGDACASVALPGVPARLLALGATEAVAVYNPPALQVISGEQVIDLEPAPPAIQAAAVIDARSAVLGHAAGALTMIEGSAGGWTTRPVSLSCGAGAVGRVDALARLGDHLVVVVFVASVPQLGVVPLAALGASTVTASCVELVGFPASPDFVAALVDDEVVYLVGNATPADAGVTGIVAEVTVSATGVPSVVHRLGGIDGPSPSAHLATPAPLQRGWVDASGALHVSAGSNALALRDGRWRRLDDPIGRGFGATVAVGDLMVTATPAAALVSHGHGFEVVDDLGVATHPARCAAGATSCTASAAGRARGSTWMLVTASPGAVRTVARDGEPVARALGGATWVPQAMAFGGDTEWIAAGAVGRDELRLWSTVDDPAPALVATSCELAVADLDAGPTMAVVAARIGRDGDAGCPRRYVVARRRVASEAIDVWWTTDEEVRQVAAPADGTDVVLALVVARDAGGAIVSNRIVELDGSGAARARVQWDGGDDLRALWAADRDHAWLAGDGGRLVRFSDDQVIDQSGQLGSVAGATLRAIAGTGGSDVFVAGDHNLLFHHDGVVWTAVSPSSQVESFTTLAIDPDEVHIGAGDRVLALRVPRRAPTAPVCEPP